jgi:hypothetical protein
MSTEIMDRVSEVQEQVIEFIESLKEPVTEVVSSVTEFVTDRVELRPLPFAEQIPAPKDVIDNQSKFATRLVSANKGVALGAARAAAPLTDPLLDRRPATRAASAKATSTKKAASRKAAAAKDAVGDVAAA